MRARSAGGLLIGAAVNAAFDTVFPQKTTTRARLEMVQRLREDDYDVGITLPADGVYAGQVSVPRFSEQGQWTVQSFTVYDNAGNRTAEIDALAERLVAYKATLADKVEQATARLAQGQ